VSGHGGIGIGAAALLGSVRGNGSGEHALLCSLPHHLLLSKRLQLSGVASLDLCNLRLGVQAVLKHEGPPAVAI